MKLYLDGRREAPKGWKRVWTARETINLLAMTGEVTHLSLDDDLGGEPDAGSGYDVLLWIEKATAERGFSPPDHIIIHSSNAGTRPKLEVAVAAIRRLASDSTKLVGRYAPPTIYPDEQVVERVLEIVLCASDAAGDLVTAEVIATALPADQHNSIMVAIVMLRQVWGYA